MEVTTTFISPTPHLVQVNTALLRLGLSVLHNGNTLPLNSCLMVSQITLGDIV